MKGCLRAHGPSQSRCDEWSASCDHASAGRSGAAAAGAGRGRGEGGGGGGKPGRSAL